MPDMRCALVAILIAACGHSKQSVALYESGDYAGAARAADQGLAAHPDDDGLWAMRVRSALALGDADGVAKAYAGYVEHRGDDDKDLLRELSSATIGQALASPSARLKIRAIETVEELELQPLADQVFEKLNDEDDRVAASAAIAVLHGYPQAPQVASDMLRSENPEARRIAVDGIGKKVGKLAVADLEKAADDPDARVRAVALRWLGDLRDADAVEVCTKRMKDGDEAVRAAAARAFAKIGLGNLEAAGKQALADPALAVRLAGVELLAAAHRDDELVQLADDKDPIVATEAAIAAAKTHPGLAAKPLDRAIAAEHWEARAGAANLLVRAVGKAAALPLARRLAADKELAVRLAAARVLSHAGDREAAAAVFAAALADPERGVEAAADLAAQDDPRGVQALSAAVRDPARTPEQRAAAAAHRTGHHVTPGLVAALADANAVVRVEAAAALGALAK